MNSAGLGGLIRRHLALLGLVLAFAAMLAVFSVMSPVFFTYGNFINIANQTAVISVLAIGMTLVMLSGGIDLSVGAVVSLSAVVCALLLDSGMGLPLAFGLSILLGIAVGAINGMISV
ncbi:MAG TPA: hypothetical protein VKN35_02645, partial [Xanthomonadales bacterium]|nr:hypothetical protein [Xanthomonadales bacterium]